MDLIVVIAVLICAFFIIKIFTGTKSKSSAQSDKIQTPSETQPENKIQPALDALTRVTKICQESGGDGFSSLIVAASSDGKVSRDELRIIMWFCEGCGATFTEDETAFVAQLNAGVNMSVTSTAGTADKIAADCGNFEPMMLARLYAAHASIGKPWNKTAKRSRDTLAVLESLIKTKSAIEPSV